jgi:leader peptidase (prepilin peptidase)/N-methyltransferase
MGLIVGSFLNVVVHRLPIMMHREWQREAGEYLDLEPEPDPAPINLLSPSSCCPHCSAPIRPWNNVPLLSFLWLKGKCANCKAPISTRYPFIEILTAILSIAVVWRFGFSTQAAASLVLTWGLIALSLIDLDHQLLPDSILIPLLWLGLILSIGNTYTDSHSAILGAVFGYLSLWIVYIIFKVATGKEGMGHGDFKLLAMLGAWTGWQVLPVIILLSSLTGAIVGTLMLASGTLKRSSTLPFGPYLSAAGWIGVLWGQDLQRGYLGLFT